MSSTEEPNAVDSKKEVKSSSSSISGSNYKGFITTMGKSLFNIAKIITLGAVGLYICKVTQANLLPDNLDQMPFGSESRIPKVIQVNMNVIKEYPFHGLKFWADDVPTTSQKAIFNNKELIKSYNDGIVGALKKRAGSSNIMLYYSKVFNNCAAWNNWLINNCFLFLNSYLPEWTIITLLGYLLLTVIMPALLMVNYFLSVISHIINLPQMFRRKGGTLSGLLAIFIGKNISSKSDWQSEEDISYFGLGSISNWFFFGLWVYPMFMICTIVMPILMTAYAVITPLFATYRLSGEKKDEPNSFMEFVKGVFVGHKVLIKILVTFAIFASITQNLQSIYPAAFAATIIGVLFSALVLNFYQSPIDESDKTQTNGEASYKQAIIMVNGVETAGHKAKEMIHKGKKMAEEAYSTGKELWNLDEMKQAKGFATGMTKGVTDKINNMNSKLSGFGNGIGNNLSNTKNALNVASNIATTKPF